MPTVFPQALGQAQQPQQADPVAALMSEYQKLSASQPHKPVYTPEQQKERINNNNNLVELGLLGQMLGDENVNNVGGQVLKQALSQRAPQRLKQGMMDPLTGQVTEDPGYQEQMRAQRADRVLKMALDWQNNRTKADERMEQIREQAELRRMLAAAGGGGGGGGGGGRYNRQIITDPSTGQQFWADPRTMQTLGPVLNPTGAGAEGGTPGVPSPMVKPEKPTAADEKTISDLTAQTAAVNSAIRSVEATPSAFGVMKGIPNRMTGTPGVLAQTLRDKKMTPEQIQTRALVYNQISSIIKERAGTAQSSHELQRLSSFLPSDTDDARIISSKFKAFQDYLGEQKGALEQKYRQGTRPILHMPGTGGSSPVPPGGAPVPSPTPSPGIPSIDAIRAELARRRGGAQ